MPAKTNSETQKILTSSDAQAEQLVADPNIQRSITGVDHGKIAERARQIWEAEGCPIGRDDENWLRAERELMEQALSRISSLG